MNKLTELVNKLIKASGSLELNGSDTDVQSLKEIIENTETRQIDLSKYVVEPGDRPYGRNILINNGKIEVVLLTWEKSALCEVHDHGQSCGIVKVLKGNISNIVYGIDEETGIPQHREEEFILDDVFFEVPKGCWHQMKNNLDERSYTLHVYAPPIEDMKVFDSDNMKMITVAENCGAWVDEPEKHIRVVNLR